MDKTTIYEGYIFKINKKAYGLQKILYKYFQNSEKQWKYDNLNAGKHSSVCFYAGILYYFHNNILTS